MTGNVRATSPVRSLEPSLITMISISPNTDRCFSIAAIVLARAPSSLQAGINTLTEVCGTLINRSLTGSEIGNGGQERRADLRPSIARHGATVWLRCAV